MPNNPTNFDIISNSLNSYVVRPVNAFGLGGFIFDIEGETEVNLSAEITDHFMEDGTTVQDHVAIKPKRVRLKNYVGEVTFNQDGNTQTLIQKAVQKLTVLNQVAPTLSRAAQQIFNLKKTDLSVAGVTQFVSSLTVNRVADYWALAKNLVQNQDKQTQAYMYLKALMEQKIVVSLQTPFEFMSSMMIESIVAVQQENSKFISDFTVTLKEIRTAEMITPLDSRSTALTSQAELIDTNDAAKSLQERANIQYQPELNLGSTLGIELDPIVVTDEIRGNLDVLPNVFKDALP